MAIQIHMRWMGGKVTVSELVCIFSHTFFLLLLRSITAWNRINLDRGSGKRREDTVCQIQIRRRKKQLMWMNKWLCYTRSSAWASAAGNGKNTMTRSFYGTNSKRWINFKVDERIRRHHVSIMNRGKHKLASMLVYDCRSILKFLCPRPIFIRARLECSNKIKQNKQQQKQQKKKYNTN